MVLEDASGEHGAMSQFPHGAKKGPWSCNGGVVVQWV